VQRRRAEEAGAPVHLARNPRRTRTARSSHSAVKLNGPVPESRHRPDHFDDLAVPLIERGGFFMGRIARAFQLTGSSTLSRSPAT
jgi:hypothetical protein